MSDDVAAGRERNALYAAVLRGSTHHFNFGNAGCQQAVEQRRDAQQHDDRNPNSDVASGPQRRFASDALCRAFYTQALQVVVFRVQGHMFIHPNSVEPVVPGDQQSTSSAIF